MMLTSCFLLAAWTISLIAGRFFSLAMSAVLLLEKGKEADVPRDTLKALVRIGCGGAAIRVLRALATSGLPWERDTVMPGRAEEGMMEARGASGCVKGTAHTPAIATTSCLMRNL